MILGKKKSGRGQLQLDILGVWCGRFWTSRDIESTTIGCHGAQWVKHFIESLVRRKEVEYGINECTVILYNQHSAHMNEYFALMTSKRCNVDFILLNIL